MKLLVQSDDYGISRAPAQGCLHGIRNGVVGTTGLFANMPWTEECVDWIRPELGKIGFGIDLNMPTGPSVLGHEKLPHITKEDGMFFSSKENHSMDTDENNHDHLSQYRDEVFAEFKAQIERYIKLVGHKPDYIHGHAYGTQTTWQSIHDLAVEYHTPCSMELGPRVKSAGMGWYAYGDSAMQLKGDLKNYIISDHDHLLEAEYGYLISHCGYVDNDLVNLSSFNTCRVRDLEALTSDEVKQWAADNNVELITFNDLPESFSL